MVLPNDPAIYLTLLSLVTLIASFIQIRKNGYDLKIKGKALALEEEKSNSMVKSMADGVLMLDQNLNLVVINPAAEKLLDLTSGKKTILDIAQKLANKIDLRSKIDESIRENKLVIFDNLNIDDMVSQVMISPVKAETGKLIGTVVLFHDVTAQKELDRVRDEFTAMMVHELRAPLTVVRGSANMFVKNPTIATQNEGIEMLKTMENSSNIMLTLVNDLLDAAKISSGKFQVLKAVANLREIITDRLTFFNQLASSKSISLIAGDLDENLEFSFDKERISQVLNNLISNALKFTPTGGKITISAKRIEPNVQVSVSDTGLGIPPEKISDLFSKFKQLQPQTEENKGTGLGLVIAKGIIESHGGKIWVESKVNEGTTFYFTLPLG